MEIVRSFNKLGKEDVAIAGGKGASLGEMTRSGIPVPEGFVILSNAFDRFIEETDLNVEIDTILHKVKQDDINTIESASEKIQSLILNAKMPKSLRDEITRDYKKLGSKYVAVRSSATAEDSASAAWAGQLDSYLNTIEKSLLENVKKCWASLFTPRAIFYRIEKGLHKEKVSVAVVVQKMIESEVSGIAFSVHPVTQDKNQIIIEAGYGLGEAIVSGQITPDSYVVEKSPRRIIDKNITKQEKGLFKLEKGGNEWKSVKDGNTQKLNDKEILELSELILKIEKHYGFPCDIEFAKEKGKFYIVQSRPITTLSDKNDGKEKNLVRKFKDEIQNDELLVLRGKFIPLFVMTDWLNFYDKTFQRKKGIYPILSIQKNGIFACYLSRTKYLDVSREGIQRYIEDERFKDIINKKYENIKLKINKFYEGYFLKKSKKDTDLLDILKTSEEYLHELVAITLFIDFLDSTILKKTYNENGFVLNYDKIFEVSNIYDFASFDLKNNVEILKWNKRNVEYLKHVYTGYSAAPTKKEIENKISKIDLNALKDEITKSNEEVKRKSQEKVNLRKKLNSKERSVEDFLSWIIEMRDDRKSLMNKMEVLMNESVILLYQNWNVDDKLSLYSYGFEVLKGKKFILENIDHIKRRQGNFVNLYFGGENYFEKYDDLDNEFKDFESLDEPKKDITIIRGQTANKGKVRGYAKVILDPKKNHSFMDGEILITGMTRPEFVPLMKKAAAIVTNEGGIACHAAIVSRELNKPCVIGTKNATEIIRDGDLVEVDADNGIVRIINKNEISSLIYEDLFNHDFPLILAQINNQGESVENLPWSNEPFIYKPYCIHARIDGMLHYLYDSDGVEWKKIHAGKFNKEKCIKESYKHYNAIKEIVENETALSRKELVTFWKKLKQAWIWFDCFFWMTEYYEREGKPIDNLLKLRKDTEYIVPGASGCLRNTLKKLFPNDEKYIDVITYEEAISGKLPQETVLKKRLEEFAYTDNQLFENANEAMKAYNIELKTDQLNSNQNELKGQIAYSGKVVGKVRIIEKRSQLNDFQKGEIIVSSSTTPDFLPAMKLSSAIISEHGGAISHAAITSRELKIPCIVGVRNAMTKIKDGNILELDTDKGVITILK